MKRYRIKISGENFLLDLDCDHGKFGFRAIRVIKADSPDEAKRIALILIRQELNRSAHIIKNSPDAPRVFAEVIEELKFFQFASKKKNKRFEFICEEQSQV